jgi:hypothetical protein
MSLETVFRLVREIAGIQIAFTQPIHIEGAVAVEGEWVWIDERTLARSLLEVVLRAKLDRKRRFKRNASLFSSD